MRRVRTRSVKVTSMLKGAGFFGLTGWVMSSSNFCGAQLRTQDLAYPWTASDPLCSTPSVQASEPRGWSTR